MVENRSRGRTSAAETSRSCSWTIRAREVAGAIHEPGGDDADGSVATSMQRGGAGLHRPASFVQPSGPPRSHHRVNQRTRFRLDHMRCGRHSVNHSASENIAGRIRTRAVKQTACSPLLDRERQSVARTLAAILVLSGLTARLLHALAKRKPRPQLLPHFRVVEGQ